jgi:hypothetical protein
MPGNQFFSGLCEEALMRIYGREYWRGETLSIHGGNLQTVKPERTAPGFYAYHGGNLKKVRASV